MLLYCLAASLALLVVYAGKNYWIQSLTSLAIDRAESKDYPGAEAYLKQALRWEDRDARLIFLYSNFRLKNSFDSGSLDQTTLLELKKNFLRAAELDPYNSEYHFQLSKILNALGDSEAASLEKKRAQMLFPAEPRYKR